MQINTSKHILLYSLLILPILLSAQTSRKRYVSRAGDTTVVVFGASSGLRESDAKFLFDKKATDVFDNIDSKYTNLEEAAYATQNLKKEIDTELKSSNPNSGALGFRLSQKSRKFLKKDVSARDNVLSLINRGLSTSELTYLYEKFGDRPSYFINGIEVDYKVSASLLTSDVLSRDVRISDTATGNPNGEVWFIVTPKAFKRLKIGDSLDDYSSRQEYGYTPKQEVSIYEDDDELEDYSPNDRPAYQVVPSSAIVDINGDDWNGPPADVSNEVNFEIPATSRELPPRIMTKQEQEIQELKDAIRLHKERLGLQVEPEAENSPAVLPKVDASSIPSPRATSPSSTHGKKQNGRTVDQIGDSKFSVDENRIPQSNRVVKTTEVRANNGKSQTLSSGTFGGVKVNSKSSPVKEEVVGDDGEPAPKRSVRRIKERQRDQ